MLSVTNLLLSAAVCCSNGVLRTLAEVNALPESEFAGRAFEVQGQVLANFYKGISILQDETGCFEFRSPDARFQAEVGDTVAICGWTELEADTRLPILPTTQIVRTGQRPLPQPVNRTVSEIVQAEPGYLYVRTSGTVFDVFQDEIDPRWTFLLIRDGLASIHAALLNAPENEDLRKLIDADVELTGFLTPNRGGRRLFNEIMMTLPRRECLCVIHPAAEDPFLLPPLENLLHVRPEMIAALRRRTVIGHVLCAWGDSDFLLKDTTDRIIRAKADGNTALPKAGDRIQVVGFPQTDLFRINLTHARYRVLPTDDTPAPTLNDTTLRHIFLSTNGQNKINSQYHGQLIRLRGKIRSLPADPALDRNVYLDSDGFLVPVETSAAPKAAADLALGCEVEVTGVCVLDTPNWTANRIFPRINGLMIVVRSDDDVRILSYPPWWTPGKLLAVIGGLLAGLIAIVLWNASLRKLAERRGRELYRAEIGKAGAELRISERTRLAVELHDSIAQNLTGAFFQVEAADLARQTDPDALEHCLKSAMQTLQSCREELRYCLWDLRNNVLDEADADDVLRRTLSPHVGSAKLVIKATLPRTRISDNTFHTLLRIARELVSNAVRHGRAKTIAVSAQFDRTALVLSVEDDGCGFDPARRPGTDEGHFGLQGIEDRIRKMSGRLTIDSRPGTGTRITVSFTPDHQEQT